VSAVGIEGRGSSIHFGDFHPGEEGGDAMIQLRIAGLAAALTLVTMFGAPALAVADEGTFKARMRGFQEVPAVSTEASGEFTAKISDDGTAIEYELSYDDLQGTVTQGHIHFGQFSVNGGIVVFLCQTQTNSDPTGLAPTCPQSGTVKGKLTAANMTPRAIEQGIAPGEFEEFVDALRAGVTYANVHSLVEGVEGTVPDFSGGEIRGQIRKVRKD
jgi:CHRD domain